MATGMFSGTVRATPRDVILGYLSDLAAASYSPERTQQMQGIAKLLSAPAISETLNRLSYGEPLTTGAGGLGGTTRIRPEALEAAMAVAPMVGPAGRTAGAGAMAAGQAGERLAERSIPEIMQRGGMGAEMLQGMSRGAESYALPTAGRMAEGYLQRQGLMPGVVPNFPTSITNRSEIKNLANDFADQFKQMGFDVTVDHSGSKAGASSYLRVSDPQTGRFLNKPIRISDHSKGAKELDANINVLNPQEDFAKITSALNDMRAKGDTLVFKQDRYAQELIASGVKPKTAYQRARAEITENQPSPYPQQAALDLAQQRVKPAAALATMGYSLSSMADQGQPMADPRYSDPFSDPIR